MQLYLIRHAQSQNNAVAEHQRVEDPGITELGRQQAKCLAERVSTLELTRLFTSPFRRTLQTTKPIYEATSLRPEVRIDLHEKGGCYRGHTVDNVCGRPGMNRTEIEREFPGFDASAKINGEGWWASKPHEDYQAARQRAGKLLQRAIDEFGDTHERVAFVMHADIKLIFLRQFHSEPLDCPCNTSVTMIEIRSGQCRLMDFNCVRHFPAELVKR
jgi:2,3-bisphosphoglycerate-dependent phosphoglycerate mutase